MTKEEKEAVKQAQKILKSSEKQRIKVEKEKAINKGLEIVKRVQGGHQEV